MNELYQPKFIMIDDKVFDARRITRCKPWQLGKDVVGSVIHTLDGCVDVNLDTETVFDILSNVFTNTDEASLVAGGVGNSAEQSNIQTQLRKAQKINEYITTIEQAIEKCISVGQFSLCCWSFFSTNLYMCIVEQAVQLHFKKLGYFVSDVNRTELSGNYITISWDGIKE